ncbi:hypothetical protein [Plastoroseomonas hellenica]|uniref:hypothetical protein n=1 Tax=Plastoroseomonas hellenica TaxID=2687306 RepID=UPI001BA60521|nr:hypothetical protein [Plastoroseomonas hellenica]MBR0646141.1 hypothetical protein [Plastoroseomonas hellenica]
MPRLRLALTALIGIAVFASPCAWDTHPRDPAATLAAAPSRRITDAAHPAIPARAAEPTPQQGR